MPASTAAKRAIACRPLARQPHLPLGQVALGVDGGEAFADRASARLVGLLDPHQRQPLAGLDPLPFLYQELRHLPGPDGDHLRRRLTRHQYPARRFAARILTERNPARDQRDAEEQQQHEHPGADRLRQHDLTLDAYPPRLRDLRTEQTMLRLGVQDLPPCGASAAKTWKLRRRIMRPTKVSRRVIYFFLSATEIRLQRDYTSLASFRCRSLFFCIDPECAACTDRQ